MKRVMAGLAFALTLIRMLTAAAYAQEYRRFAAPRKRSGALDDDD